MTKITVITVGTLKEDYLQKAVEEYEKRLNSYVRMENVNIREERISDEDNRREIDSALEAEGEKILAKIPKDSYKISLCVEGRMYDSSSLSEKIKSVSDKYGKITLIIGSSYGLSDRVKKACDLCLSVSKMTFPHQLMRVILLESLYRSFTIIANKRYHK